VARVHDIYGYSLCVTNERLWIESDRKTTWICNYPNCEGRIEIQETQ
jgi:hypothetical protein